MKIERFKNARELVDNINKLNRDREIFKCLNCGYQNDADVVGALNIYSRGTGQGNYDSLRDKEVSSAN